MLASTKFVRKVVRNFYNVRGTTYTDKSKRVENLRNITFFIDADVAQQVKKDVEFVLWSLGYTNKVKVTTSKYNEFAREGGWTYLRINNCVLD